MPIAFVMIFITMICWGSWASTFRRCGNWRFEAYYLDYAWSIILGTFVLGFIFGGFNNGVWSPLNFLKSLNDGGLLAFGWAFFGGFVWGIGNILLVAAIDLAGFSVAFPTGVGLSLVIGTSLAYITNKAATQNPKFLFTGLVFIVLAIIADSMAYKLKNSKEQKSKNFRIGFILSIVCGILIGLFPFPFNYAFKAGLNGYGATLFMTLGAFFSTLILLPLIMRKPIIPEQLPIGLSEYKRASKSWHLWAIAGGFIWSLGTVFSFVVASQPSFSVAISFTLGNCATMVATLWGILVWKEFKGASAKSYMYLSIMFLLFIVGILFISNATR